MTGATVGELLRPYITEALQIEGSMTTEMLSDYLEKYDNLASELPNLRMSVAQVLRYMERDGLIGKRGDNYYPIRKQDVKATPPPNGNGNGHVASAESQHNIPDYYRQRGGRLVTLEQSPVELENVHTLQLRIGGQWIAMPLFSNVRLCTGKNIPKWAPEQEVIRDVSAIRITYTNGKTEDMNVDARYPVTIAPLK